jgi:hypothetical protein
MSHRQALATTVSQRVPSDGYSSLQYNYVPATGVVMTETAFFTGVTSAPYPSYQLTNFSSTGQRVIEIYNNCDGGHTINGFQNNSGTETVVLPSSYFADFSIMLTATIDSGGNTVTTAPDGDTLTLIGMDMKTLAGLSGDFKFM